MVESKLVSILRFNRKGQAAIEYVLLLVITVSMVLMAMANIFKPMQDFMKNYMGTYVACLLSSGELPAIRTENNLKDADPKCNFSMPRGNGNWSNNGGGGPGGSSTNPNDPNGNGNNGNGSGGGNGSNTANKGKGAGDGSVNGNGSDSSSNGSGRTGYAGSRSRNSGFGRSAFSRSSDNGEPGDGDMAGGGGKRYVNNLDRNKDDRFFRSQQRRTQLGGRNGRGIAIGGLTEEEQKKIERKIQSESRVTPKSSEEFSVPAKKQS